MIKFLFSLSKRMDESFKMVTGHKFTRSWMIELNDWRLKNKESKESGRALL